MFKRIILTMITLVLITSFVPMMSNDASAAITTQLVLLSGDHGIHSNNTKRVDITINWSGSTPLPSKYNAEIVTDMGYEHTGWLGTAGQYEGYIFSNKDIRAILIVKDSEFTAIYEVVNFSTFLRVPALTDISQAALNVNENTTSIDSGMFSTDMDGSTNGISITADTKNVNLSAEAFKNAGEKGKSLLVGNDAGSLYLTSLNLRTWAYSDLYLSVEASDGSTFPGSYAFDAGTGEALGSGIKINVTSDGKSGVGTLKGLQFRVPLTGIDLSKVQKYDITVLYGKNGEYSQIASSYNENDNTLIFETRRSYGEFQLYYTPNTPTIKRLSGYDRYETAAAISRDGWKTADDLSREYVCIASGEGYPDALAGSPMAYELDAPLLLTKKDTLTDATTKELIRLRSLGVTRAVIFGGHGVIDGARDELTALGFIYYGGRNSTINQQIDFHGGDSVEGYADDRYGTAASIAWTLTENAPHLYINTVIITTGTNFPDALAITPVAAGEPLHDKSPRAMMPILYSSPTGLPTDTQTAISIGDDITKAIIIGGTNAVPSIVESQLSNLGVSSTRIQGYNRYTTALNIAKTFAEPSGYETIGIATGGNFPDALAGGVYAAKTQIPVILVDTDYVPVNVLEYVRSLSPKEIVIFGGETAVSAEVENILKQ